LPGFFFGITALLLIALPYIEQQKKAPKLRTLDSAFSEVEELSKLDFRWHPHTVYPSCDQ
jgi:hypothetical protein